METAYYLLEFEKKGESYREPKLYSDMIEAIKTALEASWSWTQPRDSLKLVKVFLCILSEGDYYRRDRGLTDLLGIKDPDRQIALACEKHKQHLITFGRSYNIKEYPLIYKKTSWTREEAQLDCLMSSLRRGDNITPDSVVYIRATRCNGRLAFYMSPIKRSNRDIETTFKAASGAWNRAIKKSMEV